MLANSAAPPDIVSEVDIKALVNGFYDNVRTDALLGPVFNAIAQVYWPQHLLTMYAFWNSVLLGAPRAEPPAFPRHLALPTDARHCQRWLEVFHQTVDGLFAGTRAEAAKARARQISQLQQAPQ
ncbi:group III truncated hemoglobin [Hymenobacter sp. B81]|uniref:group III truncated hemoglobin n=1 Tax=Hymenobacter sp. B81 TaxID=3344878 RepID=UPI0037DD35BE